MRKISLPSFVFIFCVCVLFSNCDQKAAQSTSYDSFKLNEDFDLKMNQKAKLYDGDMLIHFADVTEDSRCPEGVNCIQAGKVVVKLMANETTLMLTKKGKQTGGAEGNSGNYTIEMVEVNPYPKDGVKIDKDDYSIKLKVTKS
jgi:hypothetical protein